MGKEFLNIDELSIYLGIKKSTLYSQVEKKEIPHYRIGHLLRFRKTIIDSWIENLRTDPVKPQREARMIAKSINKEKLDINTILKKNIAEVKGLKYIPHHGKPDQFKGPRKGG
jgi:excisionase family DNA binding protein